MTDRGNFWRRDWENLGIGHPQREPLIADDDREIQLHPPLVGQSPIDFLQPIGLRHQRGDRGALALETSRIADEPHQANPPGLSGATGLFGNVNAAAAVAAGRSSFSGFFGSPIVKTSGSVSAPSPRQMNCPPTPRTIARYSRLARMQGGSSLSSLIALRCGSGRALPAEGAGASIHRTGIG